MLAARCFLYTKIYNNKNMRKGIGYPEWDAIILNPNPWFHTSSTTSCPLRTRDSKGAFVRVVEMNTIF